MNPGETPQNEYLRAKIMTARPEQLQAMLYDGAIRFTKQAREAMTAADVGATHDRLLRAQRIVLELSAGLRREVNPELCSKMAGLYNYVYRLLVDANLQKDLAKVDEALELLQYQRETWQLLMERLHESPPASQSSVQAPAGGAAPAPAEPIDGAAADIVGGRLSVEG